MRILLLPIVLTSDSNWVPLSVVITARDPYWAIHVLKNACMIVSAEISGIGVASGHLVNRSIIVRQYLLPWDGWSGPTISMYMC